MYFVQKLQRVGWTWYRYKNRYNEIVADGSSTWPYAVDDQNTTISSIVRLTCCDQKDAPKSCKMNIMAKSWEQIKKGIRTRYILQCTTCGALSCAHHPVNRVMTSQFACIWCRQNKTTVLWLRQQRTKMK